MKLICWLGLACLVSGCSTAPIGNSIAATKLGSVDCGFHADKPNIVDLATKPAPLMEPPENCARERLRSNEDHWHPDAPQKHGDEQEHQAGHNLRGLYAGRTTEEVKSIVRRRSELLWDNYGIRDLSMSAASQIEVGDPAGQRLLDEMVEAKQELLLRWIAGDESARLPEFN
jgi:hypothetical protein